MVTFKVVWDEGSTTMHVPRVALVTSSEYFDRMLNGPFAEKDMVWLPQ